LYRPRIFLDITSDTVQKTLPGDLRFCMERFQRRLLETIDEMIGDGKGKKIEILFLLLLNHFFFNTYYYHLFIY